MLLLCGVGELLSSQLVPFPLTLPSLSLTSEPRRLRILALNVKQPVNPSPSSLTLNATPYLVLLTKCVLLMPLAERRSLSRRVMPDLLSSSNVSMKHETCVCYVRL